MLESCNGIELLSSRTKSWNSLVANGQWGEWSEGRHKDANGRWVYEQAWKWLLQYWVEEALIWGWRYPSICHHRVGEYKFPLPRFCLQSFRILGHQNLACKYYVWINTLKFMCLDKNSIKFKNQLVDCVILIKVRRWGGLGSETPSGTHMANSSFIIFWSPCPFVCTIWGLLRACCWI